MSQLAVTAAPAAGFARVARQFVTGVAVVTTGAGEGAHGVTVSTLALASYRPPVVSVVVRAGTRSAAALRHQGCFAINVLAADQEWLARHFADSGRPAGLGAGDWRPGERGPLLRGALCWLECDLVQVVAAGDHHLLLGRVRTSSSRPGAPLVNFAGELHPDVFEHVKEEGGCDD